MNKTWSFCKCRSDRKTDRHTDIQTYRHIDRQTDEQTKTETETEGDVQTNKRAVICGIKERTKQESYEVPHWI